MDYPNKDQRWVFHEKTEAQETAPGVVRRVLAYCVMLCAWKIPLRKVPSEQCTTIHIPRSPMWHPVSLNLPLTEKYIQSVKGIRC